MQRQKTRKTIVLGTFLLFPVILYYLSPYLIILGLSKGIINGSFILFGVLFLASLFFGRGFCGWVCPGAGLQETCALVNDKHSPGGKYNLIKYFIWVPWILGIIYVGLTSGGIKQVDFFYKTYHGVSVVNIEGYIILYSIILLIALPAILCGQRAFCKYICWMAPFMIIGRKIRNAINWPSLQLEANSKACVSCKKCNKACPMGLDVLGMVESRRLENTECILCGNCADHCPKDVIFYSFGSTPKE